MFIKPGEGNVIRILNHVSEMTYWHDKLPDVFSTSFMWESDNKLNNQVISKENKVNKKIEMYFFFFQNWLPYEKEKVPQLYL